MFLFIVVCFGEFFMLSFLVESRYFCCCLFWFVLHAVLAGCHHQLVRPVFKLPTDALVYLYLLSQCCSSLAYISAHTDTAAVSLVC